MLSLSLRRPEPVALQKLQYLTTSLEVMILNSVPGVTNHMYGGD